VKSIEGDGRHCDLRHRLASPVWAVLARARDRKPAWAAPAAIYLASAALFALIEGLIFRTEFYAKYVEPQSSTGIFEGMLRDELRRKPLGADEVLVIGDSRIGEGFSAPVANRSRGDHGYCYANASVAGSTPRCWFYELRDIDPDRTRYSAVVLPVESYEDIDSPGNYADRTLDMHYVAARLRYSDVIDFTSSFGKARERFEVLRGSLFKGFIYQQDLLAFIEKPEKRLSDVKQWRIHGREWRDGYIGHSTDLNGLEVDWDTRTVRLPASLPADQAAILKAALLSESAPRTGGLEAYRRRWFGKILDLYEGSHTRLVFLVLPRGPVVRPGEPPKGLSQSIRDFGRRRGVILLPERAFESLERPEFYFDSLHLNSRGRERFSVMLAGVLRDQLGPSRN
jgi:hypothetical protein